MSPGRTPRVLITGATGYVGGRLARHLAAHLRFDVIAGSRREIAPSTGSTAAWVCMDYSKSASLRAACEGVDFVVHLAGANAQTCAANPAEALVANAVATANLCSATAAAGVKRLIYVSTAHVYGSPLRGRITEENCPRGTHPYATSHRAGEDAVLYARSRGQIEGVVIRLSNSFGPPADAAADCWMLLVPDLCRQAAHTRRLRLATSGLQRRDFVTLTDACAAIEHLLVCDSGESLFNVGGQWTPAVRELAKRISDLCPRVLGHDAPLEFGAAAPDERGDDLDFSVERLLASGFRPSRDVDAELAATLEFCAAHLPPVGGPP